MQDPVSYDETISYREIWRIFIREVDIDLTCIGD